MNIKKASQAWLLLLIVSIDTFIFLSPFKNFWIEKYLIIFLGIVFYAGAWYTYKNDNSKSRAILFFIIILPPMYLAARFMMVGILKEPICWFVLFKTLVQCILVYSSDKLKETQDKKIIFGVPLFLILALNSYYILGNYWVPTWDQARHGTDAYKVFHSLLNGGILEAWMFYDFYPSLGYLSTVPFQILLGSNYDALVFSILLFWFPLAYYFTLKIFREIFKIDNGYESFLNFAFHSNVMLLSLMKQFLMDYQMFSLLTVQFYLIIKSEKLTSNKYLILNALVCGAGFMIKESYPLYAFMLLGPYMIWIARDEFLKSDINNLISKYMKMVLAGLFIGILIVPWFTGWSYMFFYEMQGNASYEASGKAEGDPYPYSVASFIWYFRAMVYYYSWPVLLILAAGWYSFFRKKEERNVGLVFVTGFAALWLIFTLLWNKDFRYFMPAIFFFLPAYVGLAYFKQKWSVVLISSLTFFSLFVNFAQAYQKGINYPSVNIGAVYVTFEGSSYLNEPLSAAVACSLLQKQGVTNFELINKREGGSYNDLNRNFYFEQLRINPSCFEAPLDSSMVKKEVFSIRENTLYGYFDKDNTSEYVLFKDSIYACYYLYQFIKQNNKLIIREIGHYGKITGDVRFIVKSEEKIDTVAFSRHAKLEIKTSEKVFIRSILYHRHTRWPLIYRQQFVGDIPSSNLGMTPYPLIPLRSGVSKNSLILD